MKSDKTLTILIADSSEAIKRVVQLSFAPYGVDVIFASNYPEALKKSSEADLIIADAQLPATPNTQELSKLGANMPLILLCSSYLQIDKVNLQNQGFEEFLDKPFEHQQLIHCVSRILQYDFSAKLLPTTEDRAENVKPPNPTTNSVPTDTSAPSATTPALSDAIPDAISDNFATIVRQTVQEYCQQHFNQIAKETVLQEIRRLQKEKTSQF
ncbi:MAG: response regulator [Pseudomonadota bacterium]|nr:response regulator [Pseudomonadota bacterium]